MLFVVCLMTGFLASCQNSPYMYQQPQRPTVVHIFYERPPSKAPKIKEQAVQSVAKKRMPKPQSSHMTPPPTSHGYHARLDKTLYPTMNYQPFYRVLGSDGAQTYLSESVFWEWYRRAVKSGVYVKVFDPYDPKAPPAQWEAGEV